MRPLATLQNDLQNHLLRGDKKIASFVHAPINGQDSFLETRLHIYRNAYEARLIEALSSNYPCLHVYIGDDMFEILAKDYIAAHPSSFRSIRWFGNAFPSFLKNDCHADFYYLGELAEWEWKMTLAFDARDAALLQIEDMALVPPDVWSEMKISLQPSVFRADLAWNVVAIWEAVMEDSSSEVLAEKQHEICSWVVWRDLEYMNRFYQLDKDEAWGLDAIQAGSNFGDICEGLCQWHSEEEVGMRAASLLRAWIESGLITKQGLLS